MNELKEVTIYTDGACIRNPGPGGYGVVLLYLNHRKELSGGFRLTTNNRMEIFAVIVGLQALKTRCKVTVYSDSEYVVNAISLGWANKWRRNGWQRNKSEKAKNFDLWESLLGLCGQHEVKFVWIKGHANILENERCDRLSTQAASGNDLAVDEVFEREQKHGNTMQPSCADTNRPMPSTKTGKTSKVKITSEGQPCRKCGTPVIKRIPNSKNKKNRSYTYAYYFFCPSCQTMYMVNDAKQPVNSSSKKDNVSLRELDDDPFLPPPYIPNDPRDSTAMLDKCPHGVLKIKKCAICDPEGFSENQ